MSQLGQELADLLAEARALLQLEAGRGLRQADPALELPPADGDLLASLSGAETDVEEPEDPPLVVAAAPDTTPRGTEPAPVAPPSVVATTEAPAGAGPVEAARVATPAAASAWAQLAKGARAASRPRYAGDPPGEEGLRLIRADLGDCARCGLCRGRTHLVYGAGHAEADLMFIGDGPREADDRDGAPVVGLAGAMLDKMLQHVVGLVRTEVYLTDVVKCRPKEGGDPGHQDLATCRPFLDRQIAVVQPKLIVTLGRVAMETMLGIKGMARNRGRETRHDGIPLIPMFHPSDLVVQPKGKADAFADLKLIRRRYDELGGRR